MAGVLVREIHAGAVRRPPERLRDQVRPLEQRALAPVRQVDHRRTRRHPLVELEAEAGLIVALITDKETPKARSYLHKFVERVNSLDISPFLSLMDVEVLLDPIIQEFFPCGENGILLRTYRRINGCEDD